jgi:hypothetical protein
MASKSLGCRMGEFHGAPAALILGRIEGAINRGLTLNRKFALIQVKIDPLQAK